MGKLLEYFYPDEWVDSTYEIDFASWYEKGYRGITFDIDNTLVPHGAPADERAVQFFEKLHDRGFQTCLISNNKEPRVRPFAEAVHSEYIWKADKPSKKGYLEACRRMQLDKSKVLFVGDQLFTDVWGAKRVGIYSILVRPINPKEEIQIVLKRRLEKPILHAYMRKAARENSAK